MESNAIAKEGNDSFYKEQLIGREVEEEALTQARNINHNFNALNRKIEPEDEFNNQH